MRGSVNGVRAALLLGAAGGFALLVGSLFGRTGVVVGVGVAVAVAGGAYLHADRVALRAMRARPISEAEHPVMHRIVRELSREARRPVPRLYISPTATPTAFATGLGPRRAAVCVTTGLLAVLDERELRAVLAHELSHVHDRDVLVSSVAGALAATVALVGQLAVLASLVGDGDDGEARPGPLALLLVALLGPVAAVVVHVAVSRSREYRADAGGAALTGDPLALASALRTLQRGVQRAPLAAEPRLAAQSHLMIASPFRAGDPAVRLFATHPPVDERIRRLEAMAGR